MSLRNNRDMMLANIAQQSCGLVIFLVIPNLLSVENYGQITFVATLLSFIGIADLGFSYIYSRAMPALHDRGDMQEMAFWNGNIIRLRLYTSGIFSLIIMAIYLSKYGDLGNALILMLIPPMTVLIAFGVASYNAQGSFATSRDIQVMQALARLITIPSVKFFGLIGWFVAQLIAISFALLKRDFIKKLIDSWKDHSKISWQWIRDNLLEALFLGLVAIIWLQLLSVAKLFAVFSYSDAIIAQYGLASNGYMIISSLVIAAFIPQTVKTYKLLDNDIGQALHYVFKSICIAYPIIAMLALIAAFVSPYFFATFFPKFQVITALTHPIILSLISYPAIVTLGAILVGTKKSHISLALLVLNAMLSFEIFRLATAYFGIYAAAHTQFIILPIYALSLVITVFGMHKDIISHQWMVWFTILSIIATPLLFYSLYLGI